MVNKIKRGIFDKNGKNDKISSTNKLTDGNNQLFK